MNHIVDNNNIHVAIAANIATELWQRHPNIYFQTLGPAKEDVRLHFLHPIVNRQLTPTQSVVTFKITKPIMFCGKLQDINHFGTIRINNGTCVLQVTDPSSRKYYPYGCDSYGHDNREYLIDKQWPLELPNFPEVLYDAICPVLNDAIGVRKSCGSILPYLYEVKKKGGKVRHLTSKFDTDQIKTLCGFKIYRSTVHNIRASYDYTRGGDWCCNCNLSIEHKERQNGNK
tara:strand:- start:2139 stop:2825 length:687 start_codon:yes stop_codon:yes gene_type:complete